jgi:hypothetical protein
MPLPVGEQGTQAQVSFDTATCQVVSVSYVPLTPAQLGSASGTSMSTAATDPVSGSLNADYSGSGGPQPGCNSKRTEQWIEDPINLKLTEINTRLDWCDNGYYGNITSYNGSGGTSWHREEALGRCGFAGCGWHQNWSNLWISGGGLNQPYVALRGEADFGYQGYFDPSGSLYDNWHGSTLTANTYAPGDWWCILEVYMQRRPPGIWTWKPYCGA